MSENHSILLSFNNKAENLRIPVLPDKIDFGEKGKIRTFDMVGNVGHSEEARALGFNQANVYQGRELTSVSFSSFFPGESYKEARRIQQYNGAKEAVEQIQYWMSRKEPKRFTYEGSKYGHERDTFFITFPVSIESFNWGPRAGSDDIEYSITLRRYEFYAARKATIVTDANGNQKIVLGAKPRLDERVRPDSVELQPGENLVILAKRWLGDTGRYREIMELNGITAAQAKNLTVGMVIRLPQD
ncbi:hypothetical protein DUZ99_01975 [Xylanibacillus composti]|uniref:LysM domain-containing protein n=1 Tax=Xylanibacillus composti TaxID=1572762 RepID=A0A8J4H4F1_9BACL|nr:hypothetical protein [Xylanibacillus composti]MDT9723762.1 hypothetical protein [Xylanibacillus composti]GIQ70768.1 hypothetical protein XYCOK13_35920 [Xylanibacillus composti]